jgi:hypothetical protein
MYKLLEYQIEELNKPENSIAHIDGQLSVTNCSGETIQHLW